MFSVSCEGLKFNLIIRFTKSCSNLKFKILTDSRNFFLHLFEPVRNFRVGLLLVFQFRTFWQTFGKFFGQFFDLFLAALPVAFFHFAFGILELSLWNFLFVKMFWSRTQPLSINTYLIFWTVKDHVWATCPLSSMWSRYDLDNWVMVTPSHI